MNVAGSIIDACFAFGTRNVASAEGQTIYLIWGFTDRSEAEADEGNFGGEGG